MLNWDVIKYTVQYAKEKNKQAKKGLIFVIVTNFGNMDEEKMEYIMDEKISVSTSSREAPVWAFFAATKASNPNPMLSCPESITIIGISSIDSLATLATLMILLNVSEMCMEIIAVAPARINCR